MSSPFQQDRFPLRPVRPHGSMIRRQSVLKRRMTADVIPRVRPQIPVELLRSGMAVPMRTVTEEISLCGCYIASMFTMSVGYSA